MRFLDTNILLYAISKSPDEERKSIIALDLLDAEDWTLSVQVLQELYVQSTRPSRSDALRHDQALALIESWMRFPVQETSPEIFLAALETKRRFQLSYWDAAILECARAMGCRQVFSEDLSTKTDYAGLWVINPFA